MNVGTRIVIFEQYNIISAHRNCRRSASDVRKSDTIDYKNPKNVLHNLRYMMAL